MADLLKRLFGGAAPSSSNVADADFADFATAASPSPVSYSSTASSPPSQRTFGPGVPFSERPFTKWYRVHERVSAADFVVEAFVVPFLIVNIVAHFWGTKANRRRAKAWITSHAPVFRSEFAVVGFGKNKDSATSSDLVVADDLIMEKTKAVFLSYATGRQNVAFVDIKLNLLKRYSPVTLIIDSALGFFFESMPSASEKVEITAYAFDGKEGRLVPKVGGQELETKGRGSSYDGFVWAIVHKDHMKRLRDERYDLSLTVTKENPKLPPWATLMSEDAEISDMLLTPELVMAVEAHGEDFEALIVTDLPEDSPKTLVDMVPKKRLTLITKLKPECSPSSTGLYSSFLRLPDQLVSGAHFRAEVSKRLKATRDEEAKKMRKLEEEEKAEERKTASDKAKKKEREKKLEGMNAEQQRKFFERKREKDQRKSMSRRSVKA